jgi:hypothetical protein
VGLFRQRQRHREQLLRLGQQQRQQLGHQLEHREQRKQRGHDVEHWQQHEFKRRRKQ